MSYQMTEDDLDEILILHHSVRVHRYNRYTNNDPTGSILDVLDPLIEEIERRQEEKRISNMFNLIGQVKQ